MNQIQVRTSGPATGAENAAKLLETAFSELYKLRSEQIRLARVDLDTSHIASLYNRAETNALVFGLAGQFAAMLQSSDPRLTCAQLLAPWSVPQHEARRVFNTIGDWITSRAPLAPAEDTDEVWTLFLQAVAQAEAHHADPQNRSARLQAEITTGRLVGLSARAGVEPLNWTQRVWHYAEKIAPEYRRWFTHLLPPEAVVLPRI